RRADVLAEPLRQVADSCARGVLAVEDLRQFMHLVVLAHVASRQKARVKCDPRMDVNSLTPSTSAASHNRLLWLMPSAGDVLLRIRFWFVNSRFPAGATGCT